MNTSLLPTGFFAGDLTDDRRRAATALAVAMLAGATTQALFWHTTLGLNFWLWDVLVLAGTVAVLGPARLRPTAWGAITVSVLLGFSVVLYASEWTLLVAVPTTLVTLAALPLLVRDRYALADLAQLPGRALASVARAPSAVRETARLPGIAAGDSRTLRGMTRGLFIGVPTAGLFTLLLLGDADFARALERVRQELGDVVLFTMWSVANAGGYLVTHAIHRARGGASRDASRDVPYRSINDGDVVDLAPPARVSVAAWAMVIGQVSLVFGLFVAANVRHLFGGAALVRAPGSLTYATYLHSGFGELLFATMLSVGLVLVGHALLRPRLRDRAPGAAVPGGKLLALLEGTLLVLTGITVVSCWQRLRIYEDAYGASHLRLGVAFVELSVLGVLGLTLGKVLFRRWAGHAGAVLTLGAAVAVLASGMNTDAYVAMRNLDRAMDGKPLDTEYLASLSGDARAALDHPYLKDHAELAARLAAAYCAPTEGGVRGLRGLGHCSTGHR